MLFTSLNTAAPQAARERTKIAYGTTSLAPVFGEVVDGMDIVYAISKTKTDPSDKPSEPVVINKVKIEKN